jgi:hypothetical protein
VVGHGITDPWHQKICGPWMWGKKTILPCWYSWKWWLVVGLKCVVLVNYWIMWQPVQRYWHLIFKFKRSKFDLCCKSRSVRGSVYFSVELKADACIHRSRSDLRRLEFSNLVSYRLVFTQRIVHRCTSLSEVLNSVYFVGYTEMQTLLQSCIGTEMF